MSVGKQIASGFSAVLILTLLLGIFSLTQVRSLNQSANDLADDVVPGVYSSGVMVAKGQEANGLTLQHIISEDVAAKELVEKRIADLAAEVNAAVKTYQ